MKVIRLDGGIYCDALPGGEFACGVPARNAVRTHLGDVPMPADVFDLPPPKLMFTRITTVGGFRIASKAHTGDFIWLRDAAGHWDKARDSSGAVRTSPGTHGHAWAPDGPLVTIPGLPHQDSQGLRYYDPTAGPDASQDITGTTPGWVTGSPTYNPFSPFARRKGVTRLYEWTDLGDGIFVGQGDEGGTIIQHRVHGHCVVRDGPGQFIQAHRAGTRVALGVTYLVAGYAEVIWFDLDEIPSFPVYRLSAPVPIPVPPKPPQPQPEPKPVPENIDRYLVDRSDVIDAVKRDYPQLRGGAIVDQVAHRLNREHGLDPIRYGRKARQADGGNPNEDALTFRLDLNDHSKKKLIDILVDGGGADGTTWSVRPPDEEPGNGFWRPPVNADLDGAVPGDRPPPPAGGSIDAIVQKLIAAATAPLKAEIERLGAMVAALESRPVASFPERIALRSDHGKFVVAEPDGTVAANRDVAGAWETFSVVLK